VKGGNIPSDIAVMMPYILTILVLVATASKVRAPSALSKPFEREN
jgi:simple sugar transport system permease protein